jgi:hypothetical protein
MSKSYCSAGMYHSIFEWMDGMEEPMEVDEVKVDEPMEVDELEEEVEAMEVDGDELEEGELVEDVTMEEASEVVGRQSRKRAWTPNYHGCSSCGLNFPYRVGFEAHLSYCKSTDEGEGRREILKPKSRRGRGRATKKLDPTSEYPTMGNFRLHPMYLRGILSKEEMDAYKVRHLEVMNQGGMGLLAV